MIFLSALLRRTWLLYHSRSDVSAFIDADMTPADRTFDIAAIVKYRLLPENFRRDASTLDVTRNSYYRVSFRGMLLVKFSFCRSVS